MHTKNKKEIEIAEFAFNGVLFSLLGYVMVAALNLQTGANFRFWVVTALPGLVILVLSLRRCRIHWPSLHAGWVSKSAWAPPDRMNWRNVCIGLGLFSLGVLFGWLTAMGSLMIGGICAIAASVIPWWKLGFVHRSVPVALATIVVGTSLTLLFASHRTPWLYYATSAWVLYVVAAGSAMSAAWRSTPSPRGHQALCEDEPAATPMG